MQDERYLYVQNIRLHTSRNFLLQPLSDIVSILLLYGSIIGVRVSLCMSDLIIGNFVLCLWWPCGIIIIMLLVITAAVVLRFACFSG